MISGGIIMWSGAIVDIPAGYVLCDGTHGTPDLRDKFVMAAGPGYAVGVTGGASSHDHTASSDDVPDFLPIGDEVAAGSGFNDDTDGHSHVITVNSKSELPPFYALAYIMKT